TAQLSDVQIRRDDVVVGPAAWGVASPIDPGDHVIEATAPGKQSWSTHVSVAASADRKTVLVPALDDRANAASDSFAASDSSSSSGDSAIASAAGPQGPSEKKDAAETAPSNGEGGNSQRVSGWVVGSAGLASLGLGTYFGLEAIAKSNDAKRDCTLSSCTDPGAIQENSTAKADALFADITLGAGIVAVGVATYLILSAPTSGPAASSTDSPSTQSRLRFAPWVGRSVAGLAAQAGW
ncbi:MAG TPA: hypothetical protein VEK07_22395, partial [Polyangiaceae bacterium]|nr:hypothetical protein [Polyangiaceae bacterium]